MVARNTEVSQLCFKFKFLIDHDYFIFLLILIMESLTFEEKIKLKLNSGYDVIKTKEEVLARKEQKQKVD